MSEVSSLAFQISAAALQKTATSKKEVNKRILHISGWRKFISFCHSNLEIPVGRRGSESDVERADDQAPL